MVGQPIATVKPSHSDNIIDADQQHHASEKVRSRFNQILPKRHSKPNRRYPDYVTGTTLRRSDGMTVLFGSRKTLIAEREGMNGRHKSDPVSRGKLRIKDSEVSTDL